MHKMGTTQFSAFAIYNQLMNIKLYAASKTLSDSDLHAEKKAFFGSLFKTLQHVLGADLIWLRRFQNLQVLNDLKTSLLDFPEVKTLDAELAKDLIELTKLRERLDILILNTMANLKDVELDQTFSYKNMSGKEIKGILWIYLVHFFNHQTHHRGQATTLLSQFGVDVGVTDFHVLVGENLNTFSNQ